jgi:hypothetical protein
MLQTLIVSRYNGQHAFQLLPNSQLGRFFRVICLIHTQEFIQFWKEIYVSSVNFFLILKKCQNFTFIILIFFCNFQTEFLFSLCRTFTTEWNSIRFYESKVELLPIKWKENIIIYLAASQEFLKIMFLFFPIRSDC